MALTVGKLKFVAVVNIASEFNHRTRGIFKEVKSRLDIYIADTVLAGSIARPEAFSYIRNKLLGENFF